MKWYKISKDTIINLEKVAEITPNKETREIIFLDIRGRVIDTEMIPRALDFDEYYETFLASLEDQPIMEDDDIEED